MKMPTGRLPGDLDPKVIASVFSAAWRAATTAIGRKHPVPKHLRSIRLRKRENPPWAPGIGCDPIVGTYIYMNTRYSQRGHAIEWFRALTGWSHGRSAPAFETIPDTPFPKKPPPAKRAKREPIVAERLIEARARVVEWEQKRKDAQRSLNLAKTKLRSYKAQVRALERSHAVAQVETSPAALPDRALAASLTALRG